MKPKDTDVTAFLYKDILNSINIMVQARVSLKKVAAMKQLSTPDIAIINNNMNKAFDLLKKSMDIVQNKKKEVKKWK